MISLRPQRWQRVYLPVNTIFDKVLGQGAVCNIRIQSVAIDLNSSRSFDVKIAQLKQTKETKRMNSVENLHQSQHIKSFLTISQKYFALPEYVPNITTTTKANLMSAYRKLVQSFLLAAGVCTFAVGPAMADPGCEHMRGHSERHEKMMEQHHTQLHDALKLTALLEPAWKKLMDSEQPIPSAQGGKAEDWAKLTTPERAEKMLELSKVRQAQMTEHVAALKVFYGALTPEQQKTFDDFHSSQHKGMAGKRDHKSFGASKAPSKP
jgi:Spy/CpxP family protein refolding chaperone